MKTLEQLAREAGMERDGDGWFTPSGDPAGEYDVSTESLTRSITGYRATPPGTPDRSPPTRSA